MLENVLIIGFGNIGSRHVESLLQNGSVSVDVFELHEASKERYVGRLDYLDFKQLHFINAIESCEKYDAVVIATCADTHYELIKEVVRKGARTILVEKIVFQSLSHFEEMIRLKNEYNLSIAVNHIYRYSEFYIALKKMYHQSGTPGKGVMCIEGVNLDIGCNSIHYIDLFQYLFSCTDLEPRSSSLHVSDLPHKRGNQFHEYFGSYEIQSADGLAYCNISSVSSETDPALLLKIEYNDLVISIDEQTGSVNHNFVGELPAFDGPRVSALTYRICTDLLNNVCLLPGLEESYQAHRALFLSVNPVLEFDETVSIT
jgi:predicted dehydrogenase